MASRFGKTQRGEFLVTLPSGEVRRVVGALPGLDPRRALLHAVVASHYGRKIAVVARYEQQRLALKHAGFPAGFYPFKDTAAVAVQILAHLIQTEEGRP